MTKGILIALVIGFGSLFTSCDKGEETSNSTTFETMQSKVEFSMEVGIDEAQSNARSLELTSDHGVPVLSDMAVGSSVPVHLFFTNGTSVSYATKEFKVVGHKKLRLDWTEVAINGLSDNQNAQDWYVCGYIGGTPLREDVNNQKLSFDAGSLTLVDEGQKVTIPYPYAFAWTKFQWKDIKRDKSNQVATPFASLKFKPQGTLVRFHLVYSPTAAPYDYKVRGLQISSKQVSTKASITVGATTPAVGSFLPWDKSTSETLWSETINVDKVVNSSKAQAGTYWVWLANLSDSDPKFRIKVTGEPVYPEGRVIKSLLKETETGDISATLDAGISPSYTVSFNPERPLLPIEFMAEGDVNGEGTEAADGFNPGDRYEKAPTSTDNRYLPTDLDFTSVLFSSQPDSNYPDINTSWYSMYKVSHNYDTQHINRKEKIRIHDGYAGQDVTAKKLSYSRDLNTSLQAVKGVRVAYALRMIGDGNKRLSAWRYEYVVGKGMKIEAVYLGPKWEHIAAVNTSSPENSTALQYITNDASFWRAKRASGDVITRYLNCHFEGNHFWANTVEGESETGRYMVSDKNSYKFVEFDGQQTLKGNKFKHPIIKYQMERVNFVKYFRINPYKD